MDVAPGILHDLECHQQCTLESMQTYLLKVLRPDMSEAQLGIKLREITQKAESISTHATVATRLDSL